MTFALRVIPLLASICVLAPCGNAAAAEDYASYRVLETEVIDIRPGGGLHGILLSPDGSRALFGDGKKMCLWAVAQIGPWVELKCTEFTSSTKPVGTRGDMTWSPDGDWVLMPTYEAAFLRSRDTDITLLEATFLSTRVLTDDGFEGNSLKFEKALNLDVAARWLDDDTIAFVRFEFGAEPGQRHPPTLMSIDAEGGAPQLLLEFPTGGVVSALAVSADGNQIAYGLDADSVEMSGIWLLDVDTKEPVRVATLEAISTSPVGPTSLAFSADGTILLTLQSTVDGVEANLIRLATGEIRSVDPTQNVTGVAWSPTGAALAYLTRDPTKPDASGGLFLSDEPGKPGRLLIGGAFFPTACCGAFPLVWATNDTMIIGQMNEFKTLFVRLGE